jgi:hypothetical protein
VSTDDWWSLEHRGPLDEYDTPAEVDAIFRTQRRVAFSYLAVFAVMVLGVPLLTATLEWWSTGRLIGAISPNFAMAAAGLYLVFLVIGVGAASLASEVEDRMLGSGEADDLDGPGG